MRTALAAMLTCFLLACPIVCGLAEAGHCLHQEENASSLPDSPGHCPEDGDDCVCRGAVRTVDVKVPTTDTIGLPLRDGGLAGLVARSLALSRAQLAIDGPPAGMALWGDSLTVRAFLQNYRC